MLDQLRTTKTELIKLHYKMKKRLNAASILPKHLTTIEQDLKRKHLLTLRINSINTVLTEAKYFAIKNKLKDESKLTIKDQVKILNSVIKQLDKEAEAYNHIQPKKSADAILTKVFLQTFIPSEFQLASTHEMDNFIKNAKENNLDFTTIMKKAKEHKNFDMKYISQAARN